MTTLVVDTSVAAKWFFAFSEEHAQVTLRLLNPAYDLHAPDFLLVELDNLLRKRVRGKMIDGEEALVIHRAIQQYPVKFHGCRQLVDLGFDLALQTDRTVYDCLFLALARHLDCRLVTADQRFCNGLKGTAFAKEVIWINDFA
jgi:predicted nucleic acid-binding protein